MAEQLILQGEFSERPGVHAPVIPEIYEPVLEELARLDIGLNVTVEVIARDLG